MEEHLCSLRNLHTLWVISGKNLGLSSISSNSKVLEKTKCKFKMILVVSRVRRADAHSTE